MNCAPYCSIAHTLSDIKNILLDIDAIKFSDLSTKIGGVTYEIEEEGNDITDAMRIKTSDIIQALLHHSDITN